MTAARVLVVEDEPAIAELVCLHLRHAGHLPTWVMDAAAADAAVRERLPDLVLLDWMLPGGTHGPQLARRWRADPRTRELPIIMLTARASEDDLVQGLDAGADDYLSKPFSPAELMARARALLRRKAPQAAAQPITVSGLMLLPDDRSLAWQPAPSADRLAQALGHNAAAVRLGPTEYRLLNYLMAHPTRTFSRSQLLDRVWGDHVAIEERTVDVHVKRLREVMAPLGCAHWVHTVRGIGYQFNPAAVAPVEA